MGIARRNALFLNCAMKLLWRRLIMSISIGSSDWVSVSPETRQELIYLVVIDTKKGVNYE